jgi:diguanylate cyclase (GGDEF)-like protein
VQRLEDEATHDVLTGLANRRHLTAWLEQSVALAARGGASVAVLFIDLDGFKRVNDVCGHEAGDKLLQSVSEAFKNTLRQSDLLCRLGGDEFAVIAIDAAGRDALQLVGQRLIDAVVALPRLDKLPEHVVGASVGIAMHPADGDTAGKLLDAADHAMYAAKQAGKRRVRFASADGPAAANLPAPTLALQ